MAAKLENPTIVLSNEIVFYVDEKPYIYQGLSGMIMELDRVSEAIVRYMQKKKTVEEDLLIAELSHQFHHGDVLKALTELVDAAILYEQGERTHPLVRTTQVPTAEQLPVATLVLHLINACNLGCAYCYAGEGEYGAPQKIMTEETAKAAIDFLIKESRYLNEISVILFGGEPFLNWKQLKTVVEYGEEEAKKAGKTISFSLTTNGTLLNDERIQFIVDHNIGVSVSMDGDQETHDAWRPFKDGRGSYQQISQNVKKLLAKKTRKPIAARVTLTKDFPDVRKTLEHLLGLGFHEVGFAPVTETDEILLLSRPELMKLLDQFEDLAHEFVDQAREDKYLGFSNLSNLLAELHEGQTKPYGCGAGLGFMAVSPSGDLYLCHRFNEDKEVHLGNIFDGIDRKAQQKLLNELHISLKTTCSRCPLKHSCAGGCYFEARERMGEITSPNLHYCQWMLRWTKIGLEAYVRIMKENPTFMDRLVGTKECQTN